MGVKFYDYKVLIKIMVKLYLIASGTDLHFNDLWLKSCIQVLVNHIFLN